MVSRTPYIFEYVRKVRFSDFWGYFESLLGGHFLSWHFFYVSTNLFALFTKHTKHNH